MDDEMIDYSSLGAIPVSDYSEIGAIPVEKNTSPPLTKKKPVDLFRMQNPYKSLAEQNPDLVNPRKLMEAVPQTIGMMATAYQPELSLMKGATFIPRALNSLSTMGMQGGFGALATPEHPYLGAIGGALASPVVKGLQRLYGIGKNALNRITPEMIGTLYQSGHDLLKNSAQNIFENVGKKYAQRNIGNISVDPALIDQVVHHMPVSDASKKLLAAARKGDYQALRKLQTQLFHYGNKAAKSDIPTEYLKGEEIMDLRNKINKSIIDHLVKTGNQDLAKELKYAMGQFRTLQQTYFPKKLPLALKNMVHEESRSIPSNVGELLSVNSVPINRIMKQDNRIFDLVNQYKEHKNALNKLKYIAGGVGGLGILGGLTELPSAVNKMRDIF